MYIGITHLCTSIQLQCNNNGLQPVYDVTL